MDAPGTTPPISAQTEQPPALARPARVAVVGVSAAGKSTVARTLAARLRVPHVELDALWHDAGWTNPSEDEFRTRVTARLVDDEWVCDGNYAAVRDLVWSRATAVVWLDYARWVGPARAIRRTGRRIVSREVLWNDNREQWQTVLSAEHPIWWSWSKHPSTRILYGEMFADPKHATRQLVRLRTPGETRRWLDGVRTAMGDDDPEAANA
ncbi:MAG: hypothetical protein ABR520_09495 [Mycobacteriales bacterium]